MYFCRDSGKLRPSRLEAVLVGWDLFLALTCEHLSQVGLGTDDGDWVLERRAPSIFMIERSG